MNRSRKSALLSSSFILLPSSLFLKPSPEQLLRLGLVQAGGVGGVHEPLADELAVGQAGGGGDEDAVADLDAGQQFRPLDALDADLGVDRPDPPLTYDVDPAVLHRLARDDHGPRVGLDLERQFAG